MSDTHELVLVDLVDPADLTQLHEQVLAPSFPPSELIDLDELIAGCASGELRALGVRRDGQVVAGAVGSSCAPGGVVLLVYLAIAPGGRGGGIGGALLDGAVARWVAEFSPAYVLAEVEHPDHHTASPEHGDPTARLRFYARHGARVLAVPYFQPGIGPEGPRVPALLLVTLYVDESAYVDEPVREGREAADNGGTGGGVAGGRGAGSEGARSAEAGQVRHAPVERVSAPLLREFLADHLRSSEGSLRDDAATRALLGSVSGPWVDLVSPDDLSGVPVGLLPEG